MVIGFLFHFSQVTPIRHIPTPSFELINRQYFVPRCFPSKKTYPHQSPRPPNNSPRKRVTRGSCEEVVKQSNRKKKSFLLSFQLKTSSTSLFKTKGYSFRNKPSTYSISQSLKCLENKGFQIPTSSPSSQASNTH